MDIIRSDDLKVPKITGLIYCSPGKGKTTALGMVETPKKKLVIDIDNSSDVLRGMKGIDIIKVGLDMSKWVEAVEWLENGGHKNYSLVGIDNLTELEHQMLTAYGRIGKNDGAPEQGHYLRTQFKIVDYLRRLRALPCDVILTAWEDIKKISKQDGTEYSLLVPRVSGKSLDVVAGLCNIVARLEMGKEERFFRLESTENSYGKDQVFKRKYCSLKNLLNGGE